MRTKLKGHLNNRNKYGIKFWWYENENSIDIYIGRDGLDALTCRIQRAHMEDWIKRTAKRKKKGNGQDHSDN